MIIVLDSELLGLASSSLRRPEVARCHAWLRDLDLAGSLVYFPAIADYEVRRGLLSARAAVGPPPPRQPGRRARLVPVSTAALKLAAELWAQLQWAGLPTAHPLALDADCISRPRRSCWRPGRHPDERHPEHPATSPGSPASILGSGRRSRLDPPCLAGSVTVSERSPMPSTEETPTIAPRPEPASTDGLLRQSSSDIRLTSIIWLTFAGSWSGNSA